MDHDRWTDEDRTRASDAVDRLFPSATGLWMWTADAKTNKPWAGEDAGLGTADTRVHKKNNAEYHGMEAYAWQFFATAQYVEASDHFYAAARWREADEEIIRLYNPRVEVDDGHRKATGLCLRMARYSRALHHARVLGRGWPSPESFDLDTAWVDEREAQANAAIAKATNGPR